MSRANVFARKCVCLVLLLMCMLPLVGCVGFMVNLLNVAGAGLVKAEYKGLEKKKVAVVCVSNSELFGPTATSMELSNRITRLIRKHVKDVEVISGQKIEDWIDRNNWDMVDFQAIGDGVGAEMVVAVDLDSLSLYDGQTMYKGRAQVRTVVYDVKGREIVFSKEPGEILYPRSTGVFIQEMSEEKFREVFLDVIADRVARSFYAYDMHDDVAKDADMLSRG